MIIRELISKLFNKSEDYYLSQEDRLLLIYDFEKSRESYTKHDFINECIHKSINPRIADLFWELIKDGFERLDVVVDINYKMKYEDDIYQILSQIYDVALDGFEIEDLLTESIRKIFEKYNTPCLTQSDMVNFTFVLEKTLIAGELLKYVDSGIKLYQLSKLYTDYRLEDFIEVCRMIQINDKITEEFWFFCDKFYKNLCYKPKLEDNFFIDNYKIYHDMFIIIAKKYGYPLSLISIYKKTELMNNRDILTSLQELFFDNLNR